MSEVPPRRVGEVWVRREGDQTAIFDPANGRLTQLNPSALAIWELCDGETREDEIVDALVELTGGPRQSLTDDIRVALAQLRGLGLIR